MEFIYLIFREFTLNWYCYIHWHEKFQSALFIFRMVMVYRELILVIIATHIQNVVSLFVFYLIHIFSQFFFLRISHCLENVQIPIFYWSVFLPHSNWTRGRTEYIHIIIISTFIPNAEKYGQEKTTNSDTFYLVSFKDFSKKLWKGNIKR